MRRALGQGTREHWSLGSPVGRDRASVALRSSSWQQATTSLSLFSSSTTSFPSSDGLALFDDYFWVPNDPWSRIQRNQREKALLFFFLNGSLLRQWHGLLFMVEMRHLGLWKQQTDPCWGRGSLKIPTFLLGFDGASSWGTVIFLLSIRSKILCLIITFCLISSVRCPGPWWKAQ